MSHAIHFAKYHGLGNDFILIDAIAQRIDIDTVRDQARSLCDRHMGIGADGIILALPSENADIKMHVINSDGSEPEMCGNGLRCFARWAREKGIQDRDMMSVETAGGIKLPAIIRDKTSITAIEVDMGEPVLAPQHIPFTAATDTPSLRIPVESNGQTYAITPVSMGNPHGVIFVDTLDPINVATIGPDLAQHTAFPNGANIEFVQVLSPNEAVLVVWERGAGETLACGTGACATLVAGVLNQVLDRNAIIHLPGGDLQIDWQDNNHVIMTGPATPVYDGHFQL